MEIVAFVVRARCEACGGKRRVPGGQVEYGEVVPCASCKGKGHVESFVPYSAFETLMHRIVDYVRRR